MPVPSSAVGKLFGPVTNEVTARMTLAYAAAVGELGPRTFDDAAAVPLMAPPAFCVRLEWAGILDERARQLSLAPEEARRAVHVLQDSFFHRPIWPGDILATRGRIVAVRATRAGALVTTLIETTDARNGAPVAASWHGSIYRDVAVSGGDRVDLEAPGFPPAGEALARAASVAIPVERAAAHLYTECAAIWNPIHTQQSAARAAGLPGIILHGTATWAMAGRELVRAYADGDPSRLRRLRARFRVPVVPGTTLTLAHGAACPGDVHFTVATANPHGALALTDGYAHFAVS